jgi:hypothetical protein
LAGTITALAADLSNGQQLKSRELAVIAGNFDLAWDNIGGCGGL